MNSKKAIVPHLNISSTSPIDEVRKQILQDGVKLDINTLNWAKDFPYCPEVQLYLAHSDEGFWLHYIVDGQDLRTLSPADGNYVHTDSCVEFFMQQEQGEDYINFEFNAGGVCYASHHQGKSQSQGFSQEEFNSIKRWGSHLGQRLDIANEQIKWDLSVFIPWKTLGYTDHKAPKSFRANFYKCGDETAHPHYLSWSPIVKESPAFHCPEFFGEIELA